MMKLVVLTGIAMFSWGLMQIRKKSFTENILDVIIDSLIGVFSFSEVGIMLFGLMLIVLGLLEILT